MHSAEPEHAEPEVCEVEDLSTGEQFLMYRLPAGAWLHQPHAEKPRVVYECSSCRGRCEAAAWTGRCPNCGGKDD